MQHESPPWPVTAAPAAIKPVRQPARHGGSGQCLVSVLVSIHPRPPPFTGVHVFVFAQATDGGERW